MGKLVVDIKPGDWLFTCLMHPVQFKEWIVDDLPSDFYSVDKIGLNWQDEPEDAEIPENDWFESLCGSTHSLSNCGLRKVSDSYAKWFIANKVWEFFDLLRGSKINRHSQWVSLGDNLFSRESPTGLVYVYEKTYGKFRLVELRYGNFSWGNTYGVKFSIRKYDMLFSIYTEYTKFLCTNAGIEYEGI